MKKNNVIVFTIGNSDLQFHKKCEAELRKFFPGISLAENNDDENYLKIEKTKDRFLKTTKILYENYEVLKDYFKFPLIERTLDYFKEKNLDIEKLVFCVTKQNPLDKQDTYYVGEIIKKYFSSKFEVMIKYIEESPNNSEYLLEFFSSVLNEFKENNIYVSYSGGTPIMKATFLLSGVFREDVAFAEINARTNSFDFKNYMIQKKYLLKDKVFSMLDIYDFEGVKRLPVGKKIKKICDEAIKRYNFEVLSDKKLDRYVEKAKESIKLLYSNLVVCYVQGRYAEVIARIFRIEEAVGQFFFMIF